jgi:uncharacterized protein YehS (DUF1456 family)
MIASTNEVIFRIQKALSLSLDDIIEMYKLEHYTIEPSRIDSLIKRHQHKDFELCSYEELGTFLDGLVTLKRGPSPKKSNNDEIVELTNNLILKKLRIALELKEAETEIIFGLAEVELTKQELKSLFRKEGHKNFKPCSDALLMSFLEGLDEFYYVGGDMLEG